MPFSLFLDSFPFCVSQCQVFSRADCTWSRGVAPFCSVSPATIGTRCSFCASAESTWRPTWSQIFRRLPYFLRSSQCEVEGAGDLFCAALIDISCLPAVSNSGSTLCPPLDSLKPSPKLFDCFILEKSDARSDLGSLLFFLLCSFYGLPISRRHRIKNSFLSYAFPTLNFPFFILG